MSKLWEPFTEILRRSSAPTQPAASTFGVEASRQAAQQARERDHHRVIAIEKGRTQQGMGSGG